jgi:membrane protease YdiL (CAAX protease family)
MLNETARIRRLQLPVARAIASPEVLVAASYLTALALAELLLLSSGVLAGALAHGALLLMLIAHYVAAPGVGYRRLLLPLALPSLMRLIGLAVPVVSTPQTIWLVTAGTPILVAALLCARTVGVRRSMLGWPRDPLAQLAVAAGGLMHGLLAFLVLRPGPIIARLEPAQVALASVILIVFVAFTEELIFRGVVQSVAAETLGGPAAGIAVSVVTSVIVYVASLSVPFVLLMAALSFFFSWIVKESGSLWGVIGAHALLVIGLLVVWPFVIR